MAQIFSVNKSTHSMNIFCGRFLCASVDKRSKLWIVVTCNIQKKEHEITTLSGRDDKSLLLKTIINMVIVLDNYNFISITHVIE